MNRIVAILLLFLAVWFGAMSFYYRSQTDSRMKRAIELAQQSPSKAFREIQPIWEYSNFQTLGKVERAKKEFLEAMTKACVGRLQAQPPEPFAFDSARIALEQMRQMQKLGTPGIDAGRDTLIRTAHDAVPALRQNGTLAAWDAMLRFFNDLQLNQTAPIDEIDRFDEWLQQVNRESRQPLGLRDAFNRATLMLNMAMQGLGVGQAVPKGGAWAPVPDMLDDHALIVANQQLNVAREALDGYQQAFGLPEPPELAALRVTLQYNQTAIYATHLIQKGESAQRRGTAFIAELLIRRDSQTVPTVGEMYGAFLASTGGKLAETTAGIERSMLADADRRVLLAMNLRNEMLLNQSRNVPAPTLNAQYQQLIGQLAGSDAALVAERIRSHPTSVLMLLRPPAVPARPTPGS